MTTDKARKRAVRTRMTKTGERYAAANRNLVASERGRTPADAPIDPPALPPRVADPGMTEETISKGTGSGWDEWFRLLDGWGAMERSHTDIARYLREERGVDGWWAQTVTVGYERARGLRARHQTARGIEVSVSKTIAAPPDVVWEAFLEPAQRARWLEAGDLGERRRSGAVGTSATFDVPSDSTRVAVAINPRGTDRATVTVTHEGLGDVADVERRRADWKRRLARLAELWAAEATARRRAIGRARSATTSADD